MTETQVVAFVAAVIVSLVFGYLKGIDKGLDMGIEYSIPRISINLLNALLPEFTREGLRDKFINIVLTNPNIEFIDGKFNVINSKNKNKSC